MPSRLATLHQSRWVSKGALSLVLRLLEECLKGIQASINERALAASIADGVVIRI